MSKINSNKKAVDSLKAAAKEQKSQLAEIYKGALKDLKPVLESLQYVADTLPADVRGVHELSTLLSVARTGFVRVAESILLEEAPEVADPELGDNSPEA